MKKLPTLVSISGSLKQFINNLYMNMYESHWQGDWFLCEYQWLVPGLGETNGYTLGISIYVGFLTNK